MTQESRKNWKLPKYSVDLSKRTEAGLNPYISTILKNRGITSKDAEKFLDLDLSKVPSYKELYNSEKAATQILQAMKDGKRIYIHGDFDSDGVCATAVLWEFLFKEAAEKLGLKADVMPYIPSRVDEGYGLSKSSLDAMIEDKADLIISVDCGIRDQEIIHKYMKSHNIDFVITDHHQPPEDVWAKPEYTIVHQMFPEQRYPQQEICGTTVAFLLTQAMRAELGISTELDDDFPGLDLVALSTVTDMMPLVSVNRTLVSAGINQLRKAKRLGFNSILKVANIAPENLDAYHLGFVIGPRINAAGRIGSAMDALRLLLTNKPDASLRIANQLNSLNFDRQRITENVINEAKSQVRPDNKIVVAYGEGWAEGIVGLVAGKLAEEFYKPTMVITINNNEIRGSARSFKGFNITDALENFSDLLEKFGGHELAAGFTVKQGGLEEFVEKITAFANANIDPDKLIPELEIDLAISSEDLSIELCESVQALKPFGYGNKKPILMLEKVVITDKKVIGSQKNHMKMTFKGDGIGTCNALMFNCADDIEKIQINDVLDLAGSADINEWNGSTEVQFQISEWRRSALI